MNNLKNIERILDRGLNNKDFVKGCELGYRIGKREGREEGKNLHDGNCIYLRIEEVCGKDWSVEDVPAILRK